MKAIQITAPHEVALVEVETPKAGPGEVLVQVKASGFCHTDLNIYQGEFHASYPVIPGHEFAGVVVEVGEGVDESLLGQAVAVDPNVSCGQCRYCRENKQNQCLDLVAYGVNLGGGFAEYAAVKASNVHTIGDMPFAIAALAEPLACVLHGLNQIPHYTGGSALVFGAGPMGLLMMQALKLHGIIEVSMVDLHDGRLSIAKELGAKEVFRPGEVAPNQQYDVVVDATGVADVIASLPGYTATCGSILYFGVSAPGKKVEIEPYDVYRRDLHVVGSFSLRLGIPTALKLLSTGYINVEPLLSHQLNLTEVTTSFEQFGNPSVLKLMAVFD